MKFEMFDDDFEQDKVDYLKEIYDLSDKLIDKKIRGDWNLFVSSTMVSTRTYFIIVTALKVMKNLNQGADFDTCVFQALPFMPDQGFVETVVLVVAKYHTMGKALAEHFHLDASHLTHPKLDKKNGKVDKKINLKDEKK